jgi:hypothetical protein
MKPTYLYIKEHSITRLKYFGKTTQSNPYKYQGSGIHWSRHINKHGKEHVKTIWVSKPFTDESRLVEFATFMSEELDIVNSNKWANMIVENGIQGGYPPIIFTEDLRKKLSEAARNRKKPMSEETKRKISLNNGMKINSIKEKSIKTKKLNAKTWRLSEETKKKMSEAAKNRNKR